MARLPQAADLRREPVGLKTPQARVQSLDYSSIARGGNSIGRGLQSIAGGITSIAKANEDAADYETKKRLADFRLQTESELEQYKQEMQPGAAGWSEGWDKRYKKRADEFVKGIPDETQKDKVQASLISQHERLSGYAQRYATKEHQRHTEEGLGQTLNSFVGRVDRDPSSMRETRTEGRKLIESANLSPARKSVLLRNFRKGVETAEVTARLGSAKSSEDFQALRRDLQGKYEQPEWANDLDPNAANPANAGGLKIHTDRVPTAAERRKIFSEGGVVINLDTNSSAKGGQTSPMVVIPDNATPEQRAAAEAYAGRIADLYRERFGRTLSPRVVTRSKNGRGRAATIHTEPYSVKDAKAVEFFSSSEGQALHAQVLRETLGAIPGAQFSIPHNPAEGDKGAHGSGGNEVEFARKLIGQLQGGEGAGLGDDYSGPYKNLDADDRRKMLRAVASAQRRAVKAIEKEVTEIEANAASGYTLPPEQLDLLKQKVETLGTPEVQAKLNATLGLAEIVSKFQQNPPAANEAYVNSIRAAYAKQSPTPEQRERLEKLESALSTQKRMIDGDAITWAMRSGAVPAKALDMNDPESMASRLDAATETAKRFGGNVQYFGKSERKALSEGLKDGTISVSQVATSLVQNWGNAAAQKALQEISGSSPAAALLGGHIVSVGATDVAKDAEAGMRLKKEDGYKPMPTPITDVRTALSEALGTTIAHLPKTQEAIRELAGAAYETRARKNGWSDFQADEYGKIVKELLGEREINGRKYGGIGSSQSGYLWSSHPVLLPSNIRQDAFDDALDLVKVKDLPAPPLSTFGKPITDDEFSKARLISRGNGEYLLSFGDDDVFNPNSVYRNRDGSAYVFKFKDVEPMLRKRRPDWFAD